MTPAKNRPANAILLADTEITPEILSQNSPTSVSALGLKRPAETTATTNAPDCLINSQSNIDDRQLTRQHRRTGNVRCKASHEHQAESFQSSESCSAFGSSPDFANPRFRRLYPSTSDGQRQFPFRILPEFTVIQTFILRFSVQNSQIPLP